MTLRYKTPFLCTVKDRLLRQCSFVRNLAMTMLHPACPDLSGKDKPYNRSSVQENFANLQDFQSLDR